MLILHNSAPKMEILDLFPKDDWIYNTLLMNVNVVTVTVVKLKGDGDKLQKPKQKKGEVDNSRKTRKSL